MTLSHTIRAHPATTHWQVRAGEGVQFPLYIEGVDAHTALQCVMGGVPAHWMQTTREDTVLWVRFLIPAQTTIGQYPISITLTNSQIPHARTSVRLTLEILPPRTLPMALPQLVFSPRLLAALGVLGVVVWLGFSFWRGAQAESVATSYTMAEVALGDFALPPLAQVPVVIEAAWSTGLATPTIAPTPTLQPTPTPLPPLPTPLPPPTPAQNRAAESFVDGAYTYERMFQEVGAQFGVDWRLLASIAQRESGLNPDAVGGSGEQGMMQIMPATWNEFAPRAGESDPFSPYASARVAAYYLVYLRDYLYSQGFTESYWLLVAYNWGPNNLRRHIADGGDWGSIPTMRQNYAYTIVNRVNDANDPLWTSGVRGEVPQ